MEFARSWSGWSKKEAMGPLILVSWVVPKEKALTMPHHHSHVRRKSFMLELSQSKERPLLERDEGSDESIQANDDHLAGA